MSRIIQQIATVQFQVDNRKVTASMNALQTEAESLNGKIDAVKQNIKALGEVPADNKFLLEYQKQLRQLNSDLKDVTTAQRDLMKGVKAADQLWKAAQTQDIESLSIKAIKAGQNGLRKRQDNLRPELGGDEQKMYDAYQAVIDEAERVMNVFKSNYATVVQTIRDGGIVSEQAMKSTRDALRDLMEAEKEGTAEHRQLAQQYDFLNESLANVAEMRRREKGEIVNASDARREALKLTEDGIAAARRERDMADAVISGMQQQKSDLDQLRRFHEDRIAQTEREIAANQRLEEAEQDRLADVEKAMRYTENEDRKEASRLRKKADAARDEAEAKKEAYEQQAEQEKLLRQHVKDTGDEVTNLTAKIEALGKTEAKPKVDTSGIDELKAKLEDTERNIKQLTQETKFNPTFYKDRATPEAEIAWERKRIEDWKQRIAELDTPGVSKQELVAAGQKKSGLKKAEYDYFKAETDVLAYFDKIKSEAGSVKKEFESVSAEMKELKIHGFDFEALFDSKNVAEFYQRLENLKQLLNGLGKDVAMNLRPDGTFPDISKMKAWVNEQSEAFNKLKDIYRETAEKARDMKKHSDAYWDATQAGGQKREYESFIESSERRIDQLEQLKSAQLEEKQIQGQLNEAQQQSADVSKQKAELEDQRTEATKRHTKAVKDFEAQQEKTNKAQEKAYKAQEESVALNEKAATAEEKVAHQEEEHAKAMDHQSERIRQIRADGQRLLTLYEQQKTEIQAVDKAWADADVKQGEAEARKAQNQELTIKSLDDSIRKLKEANAVIDTNSDEWEENTRIIRKLQQAQDEISQKQKEMMGEWMSYAEAERFAAQAGTEGFIATGQQMQQAQQALERRRDALIKSIQVRRQEKNMTDEQKKALAAEEEQLDKVNAELKKMKFEMDNTNMSAKRMNDILDNPSAAKNIEELGQAVKRAQAQLKVMEDTVGNTNKEYQEMAQKTKEAAQRQKELEVQFKASASAFDKAWSRLKTYVGLYVGASVAMNKLVGTMGDLMDLSDKMGEVRKTTGFTADEVGRLSGELKKMDTRTALNGLLDLSVAAGQLGLKTEEDVLGFTEAANKLMVALPEMGREGATEMLKVALATGEIDKIRKQMEQGLIEGSSATAVAMEKVGSTIDRLRATSAATAPAITDFVKRVGAVGAQSGITIDQVAALGSTVDALGMRVEMSATALSRMIPAIKNNAFDVAKAIGVTPDTLRTLFETGRGMEAILMIFQHIKDAGMGEDDIESMLGMGNMKEIMKELNQMGARAGIVFSGLSQNVDELRRQLGVANQAYEENIAIQQEYDKMNETTLAKWERLKNQVEEFFVGDGAQRFLGGIIDSLRTIVDLLTGPLTGAVKAAIWSFSVFKVGVGALGWKFLIEPIHDAITGVHSLETSFKRMAVTWRNAWKSMDAATKANWIFAIGTAIYQLGMWAYESYTKVSELDQALARLDNETDDAVRHVGRLVTAFNDSTVKADKAAKKHEELKTQTEALSIEVEKLKKATDGGAESTDALRKKESELEEKEKELKKATDESNKANDTRLKLISEFNSTYSTYLGYMLNEKTAAKEVASAHQLIIAALKEERKQKGLNAIHDAVEKEYAEDIKEYTENSQSELSEISRNAQRRIMDQWRRVLTSVSYDAENDKYTLSSMDGLTKKDITVKSEKEIKEVMRQALREIVRQEATDVSGKVNVSTWAGKGIKTVDDYVRDIWGDSWDDGFGNWAETYIKRERDIVQATHDNQVETNQAHQGTVKAAVKNMDENLKSLRKTAKENQDFTDDQIRQMAQNVNAVMAAFEKYGSEISQSNRDATFGKGKDATLANAVNNILANLDQKTRSRVLRVAQKAGKPGTGGNGNGNVSTNVDNIWGGIAPADSTDYGTWDVNELVARRNQMDKFKNVLKPDTDIRAVLAEDKALMKALDNGLKEDWKSVLGWYNTERKKIQEELKSERFSTNEGHWRDEKQGRGRRNRFRESDYALAELDRYYSKRKEDLEKARIEENMSEELFNRQAELLEQEHLERRSKLRETFTAGSTEQEKQMVKQFREWWDQLEKQDLLDEVPWATVESEWSKALASEIGRNNLRAQQDLTKLQEITVKHLNEIAKLIDKERPYDGITANLRKNLTEMDILLADLQKDGPEKDTAKLVKAETIRLKFLLSEAEQAYSLNFEQLKEKMVKEGFGEWAQAIEGDEQLKQSLMQNLRNTYDAIQEAIKKESSVIKKQLEIQWNDLMPGSDMSMKGMFEKAVSDLGLAGDQVKRANSLIGAGTASDRVADKLAIQQMRIQLQMQETYFALMQKIGRERIKQLEQSAVANEREAKALKEKAELLRKEGKTAEAEVTELKAQNALRQSLQDKFDAEHAAKSLSLARTKELAEEEKQRVAIANQLEESQNRLYQELKSWADLLASSLQGVMEASHTADREYYNERAKLDLTGKGGPGAGTYIVIENEGTEDARARYEYLDERQALERQREIENDNAVAEAWKKMLDDLNQKMSEQITDWINASLQNASIDTNTTAINLDVEATKLNTEAVSANTQAIREAMGQGSASDFSDASGLKRDKNGMAVDESGQPITPIQPVEQTGEAPAWKPFWQMTEEEKAKAVEDMTTMYQAHNEIAIAAETEKAAALAEIPGYTPSPAVPLTDEQIAAATEKQAALYGGMADLSDLYTNKFMENQAKMQKSEQQTGRQMAAGAQSTFAKMALAANMYGIAYQAVSNENLSTTQKFEMIALQSVGNFAISSLTAFMSKAVAEGAINTTTVLGKLWSQLGWAAAPVFAIFTGLLGAGMAAATSAVSKSKSQIAQATGSSVSAGRLSTGMLTYAEGNVNEFTDPASLTPGRSYNVDAADGRTYRAKYTGRNPRTHITNGPEFHLVGEAGREAIIDAHTTRLMQMDDTGIWNAIQTLYNGGSLSAARRRGARRGVRAFADGNLDQFEDVSEMADGGMTADGGMDAGQMAAFQQSLDRNNELLERALTEGIHARFDVYGKGGLIDSYDQGKKTVTRHGEKY